MSGDAHGAAKTGIYGGVRERVLPGAGPDAPFTPHQLARIDEVLTLSSRDSRLTFSVYVGDIEVPTRPASESMLGRLPDPGRSVLLAVSPGQRVVEIVTGGYAAERVPNRVCALAALTMRAAFSSGDLTGGIVNGIRILSDAAGKPAAHA